MSQAVTKITLEQEHAQFSAGIKQSRSELDGFRRSTKEAQESVSGLRGTLDSVKDAAGRGSTLDEFAKTLRGAGAVAGLTLIGEALKNVTEEAGKLSAEFRKGQIDAAGIGVKIAEGLPVLGNFVTAGQSIREMLYGEQQQIDLINQSVEAGNRYMTDRVEIQKRELESRRQVSEEAQKSKDALAVLQAPEPSRKLIEDRQKIAELGREEVQKNAEYAKSRQADRDRELTDVGKQLAVEKQLATAAADARVEAAFTAAERQDQVENGDPNGEYAERKVAAERAAQAEVERLGAVGAQSARDREKKDVADHRAALDQKLRDDIQAIKQSDTNELRKQAAKTTVESIRGYLTDLAGVGKAINEAAEKIAHEKAEQEIERAKKLKDAIAELKKEADQAGLTEAEKRADDLRRDGADAGQQADARRAANQIDAAAKHKSDMEEAKRLAEESLTPVQKFSAEAEKINRLFAEGLISETQAQAALDRAGKEEARTLDKGPAREVSAEIIRFNFNRPKDPQIAGQDGPAQQLAVARQQLDQLAKQSNWIQQIYNFAFAAAINPPVVVTF